jgi:hypothetical protein
VLVQQPEQACRLVRRPAAFGRRCAQFLLHLVAPLDVAPAGQRAAETLGPAVFEPQPRDQVDQLVDV